MQDAHHRAEFRIARLAKRLVQALAIEISRLRDLCHAPPPCYHPERAPHESRVAGFERRRDVGGLALDSVEIFGGVKSRRCNHPLLHAANASDDPRSEEHTSELQSRFGI